MAKKKNVANDLSENSKLIKSKEKFKEQIEERIRLGETLLKKPITTRDELDNRNFEYSLWNDFNLELLKQSFDIPNNEYKRHYVQAGNMLGFVFSNDTLENQIKDSNRILQKKIQALHKLNQKLDLLQTSVPKVLQTVTLNNTQVFIVHGQDDSLKNEVARFIQMLGLEPIILHEMASSGKTIIEKIENYSNVGFGVVLYTPCDLGAKKDDSKNLKNRARQNVVFEHGFLIGKIGRKNVAALVKGDIEKPNDIAGVVYISTGLEWKLLLAREMKASGYNIDMNLVI
jgi:predicted nucleotide-binding protein